MKVLEVDNKEEFSGRHTHKPKLTGTLILSLCPSRECVSASGTAYWLWGNSKHHSSLYLWHHLLKGIHDARTLGFLEVGETAGDDDHSCQHHAQVELEWRQSHEAAAHFTSTRDTQLLNTRTEMKLSPVEAIAVITLRFSNCITPFTCGAFVQQHMTPAGVNPDKCLCCQWNR